MLFFLRRKIPFLVSSSANIASFRVSRYGFPLVVLLHSGGKGTNNVNMIVTDICDAFRKGFSWDVLSRKFNSIQLNDSLVEEVLLNLKEPVDAKRALGFFHWSAKRKNLNHGIRLYCIAIHILVAARLRIDARALLETVLKKHEKCASHLEVVDSLLNTYRLISSTPYVFDLLVQSCSKLRMLDAAFNVCGYLEEHGLGLSVISFNTVIHVAHKSDQGDLAWKVYEHMIRVRAYPDQVTIRNMVNLLCKEGTLQKYVDIVDRIHGKGCSPMMIVNTGLIIRIIEEGRIEEGMPMLRRMLQKNLILDTLAFSLTVRAKISSGDLESAWAVYEGMVKRGFNANSFVYTSFIEAYCKHENIEEAEHLVQEMEDIGLKPYEETFNLLIEGCAKAGKLDVSLTYCEEMLERELVPSYPAFNEALCRLSEIGSLKRANAILTQMIDKGFSPDELTYSHLIFAYGSSGDVQEALKLYHEMQFRSLTPGKTIFISLIRCLSNSGKSEEAKKFLQVMIDRLPSSNSYNYETLIGSQFDKGETIKMVY